MALRIPLRAALDVRSAFCALVLIGLCACGSKQTFEPQVRHDFPPMEVLTAERDVPAVRDLQSSDDTSATWELRLLPRGDAGNAQPPSLTATEAQVALRFEHSRPDLGLRCVALEVAHRETEGQEPTLDELAWLEERCGVGAAMDVRYAVSRQGEAAVADAMVATGLPAETPLYFGAGRVRAGDETVFAVAWGRARGIVNPFSTSGERFTVEGVAHSQYHWVQAAITRDDTRVARCRPDTTVVLPDFRFECVAEPGDDEALIELWAGDWRRLIGESVMIVRVSPSGMEPTAYVPNAAVRAAAEGAGVDETMTVLADLEQILTELRRSVGLERMRFDAAQSAVGATVLRLLVADWLGPTPGVLRNGLLQGMLAGYELDEEVMGGRVTAFLFSERLTSVETLDRIMDYPRARLLLTNEQTDVLAVALGGDSQHRMTGALLAGWQDGARSSAETVEARLVERMNQWRDDRGLDPIDEAVPRFGREVRASAEAIARGAPVEAELESMTRRATVSTYRASGALMYELLDPETFELRYMAEVLEQPNLRASIAAARWDDPDNPWGTYVVLVIYERSPT